MDIRCVVCGEPWDAWGVNHGDMAAWETDLFRKGSGCPCCEGVKPERAFEPKSIDDLENGDGDPMERIVAFNNAQAGNVPKWEAPKPEVLHTCDGCGVQLVHDLAAEVYNGRERKPVHVLSYSSPRSYHSYLHVDENDLEGHEWRPWGAGRPCVCPACTDSCHHCGAVVSSAVQWSDVYDVGYCMQRPGYYNGDVICEGCYEQYCSECESPQDDCTCHDDDDDDDDDDSEEVVP